mgnify:CR=1 FL=1
MKLIGYLAIIFIAAVIIGLRIELPYRPIRGQIQSITIKYTSIDTNKTFHITATHEVEQIKEAVGIIWFKPLRKNSREGYPKWILEINRPNDSIDVFYIDENEFDKSGRPSNTILKLLKDKYS